MPKKSKKSALYKAGKTFEVTMTVTVYVKPEKDCSSYVLEEMAEALLTAGRYDVIDCEYDEPEDEDDE